jgi:hypothetical protein
MQRRTFLKTTAALAAIPSVEATTGGIPAPFDAMPTLEDPPERVRELAQVSLPPRAVPDDGPILDYHHQHTVANELVSEAVEYDCDVIAFEDLTNIRERLPHAKWHHI